MVNGLQLFKTKWNEGFTKQNHLSRAYLTEPEVISTVVHRIFGMQGQNPLQYLTSGMGRSKELNNREYDWYLQGDDEKAIKIIENISGSYNSPCRFDFHSGIERVGVGFKFRSFWKTMFNFFNI